MTVFILCEWVPEEFQIVGVFSSRDLSEAAQSRYHGNTFILECQLDAMTDANYRTVNVTMLNLHGVTYHTSESEFVTPDYCESRVFTNPSFPVSFWGKSAISADHATELAKRARQQWFQTTRNPVQDQP